MESIALRTRDIIVEMEKDAATTFKSLKVDGGASAMNLLLQLQSDHLQVPVSRPISHEVTALGAAYLAGLASGFWNSLEEIGNLWSADFHAHPNVLSDKEETKYQKWLEAVSRSLGWES